MPGLTLVINLGSSSLKAALVDSTGAAIWIGNQSRNANEPVERVLDRWLAPALEPRRQQIQLIGHRVVHGGDHFTAPTLITKAVEHQLHSLTPLAPLHNPPALAGLAWARSWAPNVPQWACFDTAFHSTLPDAARTYALPEHLRRQGLRRFGFHGINHQHVSERVATSWRQQGHPPSELRLISAHLGAGASLAAVQGHRCIDTTMGFTPLEGLVMATRSGSLDPGLILDLIRQGHSATELNCLLQRNSGLKGLSGLSGDMREIRQAAQNGHAGATLALAVFRHRLLQHIGAMAASLRGLDVLALTGGIGEHDHALRNELKDALSWLPAFKITVIPADEEGMIARLCRRHSDTQASVAIG
ncbi:MAG: acetate/propionate family kinase [Synechococcus sp.]